MTISATQATTASGNWSFVLNDSTNGGALKEVALALNESDHVVFGYGNIAEGNNTQQVTASGLEDGNRLDLNLTTLGTVNLYMLTLTTNGDSAAGEYRAHSADGQSWTGNATGTNLCLRAKLIPQAKLVPSPYLIYLYFLRFLDIFLIHFRGALGGRKAKLNYGIDWSSGE